METERAMIARSSNPTGSPPTTPHSPARTSRSGLSLPGLKNRSGLQSLGQFVGIAGKANAASPFEGHLDSSKNLLQVSMKWSGEDLEAIDFSLTGILPGLRRLTLNERSVFVCGFEIESLCTVRS